MRTTLNIDPELLAEVVKTTGEGDKGRALNRVMADFLRREKRERLLALRGKLDLRDNWKEWEDAETRESAKAK